MSVAEAGVASPSGCIGGVGIKRLGTREFAGSDGTRECFFLIEPDAELSLPQQLQCLQDRVGISAIAGDCAAEPPASAGRSAGDRR